MKEQFLQTKIINYAKSQGWLYIKIIKASKAGHSDLIFFKGGMTIFIEVKKEKTGVKSELQLYQQQQFRDENFIWEFVDSLQSFKEMLNKYV